MLARILGIFIVASLCIGLIMVVTLIEQGGGAPVTVLKTVIDLSCDKDAPTSKPGIINSFPKAQLLLEREQKIQGQVAGFFQQWQLNRRYQVEIRKVFPRGTLARMEVRLSEFSSKNDRPSPLIMAKIAPDCAIQDGRAIHRDHRHQPETLVTLNSDLEPDPNYLPEPLNPAVPSGSNPASSVLVAQIDSGVNYLLTEVSARLARDRDGKILGFDYWDMDAKPFDLDPSRNPFYPQRHGTTTASIFLREAPRASLVPYRYPRFAPERFSELVDAIDRHDIRIVFMAMGSNKPEDWTAFETAVRDRPHILFIISAGNNSRNIDEDPVYPAALGLDNILVVSSADPFGRLARGSNYGGTSVDVITPGEQMPVIDHRGVEGRASGSSYAVPRIAALAARLLQKNPNWAAEDIKTAIIDRARPSRFLRPGDVRYGWIPNPSDDG